MLKTFHDFIKTLKYNNNNNDNNNNIDNNKFNGNDVNSDNDDNSDKDILFTNDNGYSVITGDINKYSDKQAKHEGCFEIVEINGEKTVVEIYYEGLSNQDKCVEYLNNFNELNNLKPIEV